MKPYPRYRYWMFICLFLLTQELRGVPSGKIEGTITNSETSEPLIGVSVIIERINMRESTLRVRTPETSVLGASTDLSGYYFTSLPLGIYTIKFQMIGYLSYEVKRIRVNLNKTTIINARLVQKAIEIGEITIIGERSMIEKIPQTSVQYIRGYNLKNSSGILEDLTRMVQTLPGVVSPGDFSGRMYVRGGKADENVVLLDRIYVYEPYHLNGLVSIFNLDLIERAEFYAGGFPAKYGQAMSSVLEVYNRYGKRDRFKGSFGLSMISANSQFEGGLPFEKGSWLFSARRNYHDIMLDALKYDEDIIRPTFYDYQLKLFYPSNENNLFEINLLRSGDKLKLTIDDNDEFADFPADGRFRRMARFDLVGLDWKHIFSSKAYTHTNFSYSGQIFDTDYPDVDNQELSFDVKNFDFREEATFLNFHNHKIETGLYFRTSRVEYIVRFPKSFWNDFNGDRNTSQRLSDDPSKIEAVFDGYYRYGGGYIQDQWDIFPSRMAFNYGIRAEYFDTTDEFRWSPRFALYYQIDSRSNIKAAYGLFDQFPRDAIQLDPNAGNRDLKAQKSFHYILGDTRENYRIIIYGVLNPITRIFTT